MCPDRHIISVYFDNELDSPWKEKLEAHLAGCPACRAVLTAYGTGRELLRGRAGTGAEHREQAAQERIWENLEPHLHAAGRARRRPGAARRFWGGSVRIPLPAAAAAGLVLAAVFALLFAARQPQTPSLPQLADMGMEVRASPVSDMSALLEYLDSENSADMVIIRLPETATFKSEGEPRIIRAADYSRNAAGR